MRVGPASVAMLRSRLAAANAASGPPRFSPRGDHDLNPDLAPAGRLVEAAVLVGLIERAAGPAIVMTRRTETLKSHAGQISFPGGRLEPADSTPVAAALREAREEIGLDPARVEILGRLDTYVTRTGFSIVPIVGLIAAPVAFRADPTEVAEIFELPLGRVVEGAGPRLESREFGGRQRLFFALPFDRHYIWGATAGMLVNLRDVLEPGLGGEPAGDTNPDTAKPCA